jgi:hypothetical protein
MATVSIGHRLALDVKTARDGDSLYLLLNVLTDWGQIPIHIGVHADTLKGIASWLRSNYGNLVYDFVVARKPGR